MDNGIESIMPEPAKWVVHLSASMRRTPDMTGGWPSVNDPCRATLSSDATNRHTV